MKTIEEEQGRAAQAHAILINPLVIEAFDAIEDLYYTLWRTNGHLNPDEREHLYRCNLALDTFKSHFETIIETGNLANIQKENMFKVIK